MRLVLLFSCLLFVSCAKKQDQRVENYASEYISTLSIDGVSLQCTPFDDNTFHGRLELSKEQDSCMDLYVKKYPKGLFSGEDKFVQFYPFLIEDGEEVYGKSVPFFLYERWTKKPVIKAKIVDSYLLDKHFDSDGDGFFEDHHFRFCNLPDRWDAIQMVIYKRQNNKLESSIPIRRTKILIPPFPSHPGTFSKDKGEVLAAYHPFYDLKEKIGLGSSSYYKLSQSLCSKNQ